MAAVQPHWYYIQNADGTLSQQYGVPPTGYQQVSQAPMSTPLPSAPSMVATPSMMPQQMGAAYSYSPGLQSAASMVATPAQYQFPQAQSMVAMPAAYGGATYGGAQSMMPAEPGAAPAPAAAEPAATPAPAVAEKKTVGKASKKKMTSKKSKKGSCC
eukprot:gb/GFBE01033682.1/.p1 GENE.gb/GFBE01033682.1/~~gb/GFBE01033682.1/.p1  ORF type:complete len:157 (+),score=41.48 gb/GFBE01033682.1/:1-471(+)